MQILNRLLRIYLLISCFSMCKTSGQESKQEDIGSFVFINTIPLVNTKGVVTYYRDSISIYYTNKVALYRIQTTQTNNVVLIDKNGNQKEGSSKSTTVFDYFIHKIGDSVGYYYKNNNPNEGLMYSVVNFLGEYCSYNPLMFQTDRFSLISSEKGADYELTEKYAVKYKSDESICDSLEYFYSSKYNGIPYSFSSKIDSLHGLKLSKAKFIYTESFSNQYKIIMPKREFIFELKKVSEKIDQEIVQKLNSLVDKN